MVLLHNGGFATVASQNGYTLSFPSMINQHCSENNRKHCVFFPTFITYKRAVVNKIFKGHIR